MVLDGEICIEAGTTAAISTAESSSEISCVRSAHRGQNDYVSPMMNELAINMAFEKLVDAGYPGAAVHPDHPCRIVGRLSCSGSEPSVSTWGAIGGGGASSYTFRGGAPARSLRRADRVPLPLQHPHGWRNRHDLPAGWAQHATRVLAEIDRCWWYEDFVRGNKVVLARTAGVGVVDPALAIELGISGPVLRASGVDVDLRRDQPYAAYDEIDIHVPTHTDGDCFARYVVRVAEMRESIRIATELLKGVPEGPICSSSRQLPGAVKATRKGLRHRVAVEAGHLFSATLATKVSDLYRCGSAPEHPRPAPALPVSRQQHLGHHRGAWLARSVMGEVDR